jgi:hypothetical protein
MWGWNVRIQRWQSAFTAVSVSELRPLLEIRMMDCPIPPQITVHRDTATQYLPSAYKITMEQLGSGNCRASSRWLLLFSRSIGGA